MCAGFVCFVLDGRDLIGVRLRQLQDAAVYVCALWGVGLGDRHGCLVGFRFDTGYHRSA